MYSNRIKRSRRAPKRKAVRKPARKGGAMRKRIRKNASLALSIEKKYIQHGFVNQPFSQQYGVSTVNGYYYVNTTPNPIQGLAKSDRIGSKVFLTGSIMDLQILTGSSTSNQIKYKYYIVRVLDGTNSPVDITPDFLDPNPFVAGIYDWHSNPDPENASKFKVIAKGQGTIRPDSIAGQTGIVQYRKYLKLGFPLKWDADSSSTVSSINQWRVILLADSGDYSVNTGMVASMNFRTFYLDN